MIYQAVLKTQPDGKLVSLAASGSEPAFEAIVHRYRRPLLGYCRRLRLSDNRSEDVVQQTFINAWGTLRQGTDVRELRPWLYRITHNQAVSMLRAAGGDEASLTDLPGNAPSGEYMSAVSAEASYERQARLRETLTAIAELPALQREALLATAVDGLSYEEVAVALNTSGDAVRGLVYRARNSLRAGVAAVSPSPLVVWAANRAGSGVSAESISQWLTEVSLGGGSVGISAVAVKGAAVVVSSAAVVGGAVSTGLEHQVFGGVPAHHAAASVRPARTASAQTQPSPAHGVLTASVHPSGATKPAHSRLAGSQTTTVPAARSSSPAKATRTHRGASAGFPSGGASGTAPRTQLPAISPARPTGGAVSGGAVSGAMPGAGGSPGDNADAVDGPMRPTPAFFGAGANRSQTGAPAASTPPSSQGTPTPTTTTQTPTTQTSPTQTTTGPSAAPVATRATGAGQISGPAATFGLLGRAQS